MFRPLLRCSLLLLALYSMACSPALHANGSGSAREGGSQLGAGQGPGGRVASGLAFEENLGQAAEGVAFFARRPGHLLLFTPSGVQFAPRPVRAAQASAASPAGLRLVPVGGNPDARMVGHAELPGRSHYLIGPRERWHLGVRSFGRVRYRDVFPGIDLDYYGRDGNLEYAFVVAPGADPRRIALAFEGADRVALDPSGDLRVEFAGGVVRQRPPVAYQERDGLLEPVGCRPVVRDSRQVAFELAAYDATRPLVIDPVLVFSIQIGGPGADAGHDLAMDDQGFLYVAGQVEGVSAPSGGTDPLSPATDAFVLKLDPTRGQVEYAAYFGGSAGDAVRGIAVDAAGAAYVVGETLSEDFPASGSVQLQAAGGGDGFLAKLALDGSDLEWATYLGGSDRDVANDVGLAANGDILVYGDTASADLPTVAPLQPQLAGGTDAFVAKLDASGTQLVYATYLGGSDHENPVPATPALAVDAEGSAYLCGTTQSYDFPTVRALQARHAGGGRDAFVSKLDPSGSSLVFSTFLGGGGGDTARGIARDAEGNLYVGGATRSYDFPLLGAFQARKSLAYDAFVTKLDSDAQRILYSTYLGGNARDVVHDIAVDASGSAYVLGYTASPDFPVFDAVRYGIGGTLDAFVAKLTPGGSSIAYSTFLGGQDTEVFGEIWGGGVVVDAQGRAFVAGSTSSQDFPLTVPPKSQPFGSDAFASVLDAGLEVSVRIRATAGGQVADVDVANRGVNPVNVELRAWFEVESLGLSFSIFGAPDGSLSLAPGEQTSAIADFSVPDSWLDASGFRFSARLIDPMTGQTISESICEAAPCH